MVPETKSPVCQRTGCAHWRERLLNIEGLESSVGSSQPLGSQNLQHPFTSHHKQLNGNMMICPASCDELLPLT